MVEFAQSTALRREQQVAVGAFVRRLDWVLLSAVAGLVVLGLWAISGITTHDLIGSPPHDAGDYYVVRQGVFAAVGAVGFTVCLFVDPDQYRRHWRVVYGALIFILLLVLAAEATRGSRRWIEIGFFRFQPSEF